MDTALQAIEAGLKAALGAPLNRYVGIHGGRFAETDVRRYAKNTPAQLLVSALGAAEPREVVAVVKAEVTFALYCLASAKAGTPRPLHALQLVSAVLPIVRRNRWELCDADLPTNIRAANLYNGQLDALGVALWGLTWRQWVPIQPLEVATWPWLETTVDPAAGETGIRATIDMTN